MEHERLKLSQHLHITVIIAMHDYQSDETVKAIEDQLFLIDTKQIGRQMSL